VTPEQTRRIRLDERRRFRDIFWLNMAPRTRSEDSDPVLEVSAVGTADSNGEYLQHEAVAPHKPHAATVDPMTVIIRSDTVPPSRNDGGNPAAASDGIALQDAAMLPEETTSITKGRLRAKHSGLFRVLTYVEAHRVTTLMFVVGALLLLLAGLLAAR
jgi:hypothetical protein